MALRLNKKIGYLFAQAINESIEQSKLKRNKVKCVAISGQTIKHDVAIPNPFSMQIGDPNVVCHETGLTTISDFRNMHISLGGEGAPLVPEFHNELFHSSRKSKIILNIGGIANYSYIKNKNLKSNIEHEATTSKISDEQLYYCNQRGLNQEEAVSLIVNGFCKEVLQQLPMEFAVEAQKLVGISLEGSVG